MIVFDLKCGSGHVFEAWFKNSETYEAQRAAAEIACPSCGDTGVVKAPMAPNIATGGRAASDEPAAPAASVPAPSPAIDPVHAAYMKDAVATHMKRVMEEVKAHVEKNFDYVGDKFAEEARKIHYGEEDPRPIYGEATKAESVALRDEGIDFLEIPFPRKADA